MVSIKNMALKLALSKKKTPLEKEAKDAKDDAFEKEIFLKITHDGSMVAWYICLHLPYKSSKCR